MDFTDYSMRSVLVHRKLHFIICCIMSTSHGLGGWRRTDFTCKVQTCFEATAGRVTVSHRISRRQHVWVSERSKNRKLQVNSANDNRANSRRAVDSSPPGRQRLPGVLLVVEGLNDMRAIKRCLEVDVSTTLYD